MRECVKSIENLSSEIDSSKRGKQNGVNIPLTRNVSTHIFMFRNMFWSNNIIINKYWNNAQ